MVVALLKWRSRATDRASGPDIPEEKEKTTKSAWDLDFERGDGLFGHWESTASQKKNIM